MGIVSSTARVDLCAKSGLPMFSVESVDEGPARITLQNEAAKSRVELENLVDGLRIGVIDPSDQMSFAVSSSPEHRLEVRDKKGVVQWQCPRRESR